MEEEVVGTREAPTVRGRGSQPELREEQARPSGVAATVEFSTVQVPEPGTWLLAAVGLLSIWIAGRRNICRNRQTVC